LQSAPMGRLSAASYFGALAESAFERAASFMGLGSDERDLQVCPRLDLNPDAKMLDLQMKSGPVRVATTLAQSSFPKEPHHVFISGPAHGGTTAMYNLLSTSPEASNICAAKTLCCEGTWLLERRHLMTHKQRNSPEYPRDWNSALGVFSEYWNMSKKVLLEKSPESASKFTRIYEDLKSSGKRVSFIYVTRSSCYPPHTEVKFTPRLSVIVKQVAKLKAAGARVLVVKMEDLENDPYGVARKVLGFLPELQSVDPMSSSIDGDMVKQQGAERSIPLALFASGNNFTYGLLKDGRPAYSTAKQRNLLRQLGYAENFIRSFAQ